MKARFATLALAGMLGLFLAPAGRADITLNFSSVPHATINVAGSGSGASITFTNASSGPYSGYGFAVGSGSGSNYTGSSVGDAGTMGGTYSYSASGITIVSSTEQTAVLTTSGGTFSISDGTTSLTGAVQGVNIETNSSIAGINLSASINLTGVSYSGSDPDLTALATLAAASGGSLVISFQDTTNENLTQMAASGALLNTSYSGSVSATAVAVPEPSTMAIAGLGALGMIGYGLRRRKALGA